MDICVGQRLILMKKIAMNKQVTLSSKGNIDVAEVSVDQREKPLLAIIAIYSFSIRE